MTTVVHQRSGQTYTALTRHDALLGADAVADYFDGDQPGGLFAPPTTDAAARSAMLAYVDRRLTPAVAAAADGPGANGAITEEELTAALATMRRGRSPGMDGLPYEFYHTFWTGLAKPLLAAINEPFLAPGPRPSYDWRFTAGVISLIFKGTPTKP